ncbi:class I SAM-dependent methyltransferase [Natronobacterium gregoryi]|uniref:Class I SAM-dependent methyltransferase n=2 Tax=Natronobacterium gregoryi TaxID=44930 RepID=L0ACS4_NATGS|nr:class I SAM-dependent methyltransferase [Natronobacterium gregoryi]AFZ71698.1 hypothetical protein Natgr_0443 [Natronobacterium gregoryi SP2]ELY72731.1 hypothetical protein C490_02813 [Natronobacterium gregoryi SP2]PLK20255.1 class I SAM-dependent methyltransferase [Natronobacterium gregoryi SP2]SFJ25938.1 hypothetical protein SAMN05443661_11938 [Natronobacterium gregoryi]
MSDAFGRALLDHYRGQREDPLYQRDGDRVLSHPVEDFYFGEFEAETDTGWLESHLEGSLLDVGAGAGRDALYFQARFETVALEVSESLVTLLAERGVEDVRHGNMFDLRETFDHDRFRSVLIVGTQLGLAGSMAGLQALLEDLATITTPAATVVVDGYDPTSERADEMLGFRADPTPGLAYRVLHYEYADLVGDTLFFRLFSPDRLREATTGTDWIVTEVRRPRDTYYYRASLEKQ